MTIKNYNELPTNTAINIEYVPNGGFFTIRPNGKTEYEKLKYCRHNKKYECGNLADISAYQYLRKGRKVYTTY